MDLIAFYKQKIQEGCPYLYLNADFGQDPARNKVAALLRLSGYIREPSLVSGLWCFVSREERARGHEGL